MVSRESAPKQSAEVAPVMNELPLSVVNSFKGVEDVEQFFAAQGITLSAGEEISDGFETVTDKDRFLKTSFVVIDWKKFYSSEFGQDAMTIRIMTLAGEKYRLSDGSTGIMKQLEEITEVRLAAGHAAPNAGLICKDGLTKSEYWVSTIDGKAIPTIEAEKLPASAKRKASTYYLAI